MLFFRSEEAVRSWCRDRGYPLRPRVPLTALWRLARAWYSDRLSPDARRPRPEEVAPIFSRAGLDGAFWDPLAQT